MPTDISEVSAASVGSEEKTMEGFIKGAVRLVRRSVRHTTVSNFGVAGFMRDAIAYDISHGGCSAFEEIGERRLDVVGRFSRPLSKASGVSLTTSRLAEYIRIDALRSMLDEETAALCGRVNWESLRVLAQWAIHVPGETHFVRNEGDTAGEYEEVWTVKEGCEEKLVELIGTIAGDPATRKPGKPIGRGDLVKALRSHEARIAGEEEEEESKGPSFKDKTTFIASIETRAKALKMSKSELSDWLVNAKLVTIAAPVADHAKLSVADADAIAAALIASRNAKAMDAIVTRFKAHDAETLKAMAQPATKAHPSLNDSGKPNDNPTA